jgi:uncharacterized protein DUF4157
MPFVIVSRYEEVKVVSATKSKDPRSEMGRVSSLQYQKRRPSMTSPYSFEQPVSQFASLLSPTHQSPPPAVDAQIEQAHLLGPTLDQISVSSPARPAPAISAQHVSQSLQERNIAPPENHTGLPDALKAGIECLSGFSLDDVRVHYNSSKPAEVDALAYTQGEEIYMGSGQEQHLAHEAWHVVQQMQGRVKPALQMKGMVINNDSGLEREADVMGEKVRQALASMNSMVIDGSQKVASLAIFPTIQPKEVIQRRVGFEFEASATGNSWKIEGKLPNGTWERISHTKASLILTRNGKGAISADNGNVEFRTEPLSTLQEVTATIDELVELKDKYSREETILREPLRTDVLGIVNQDGHNYQEVRITGGGTLSTRPQATLGIKLSDIPALLEKLRDIRGEGPFGRNRIRIEQNYGNLGKPEALQQIAYGEGVTAFVPEALELGNKLYDQAVAASGRPEPPEVKEEIVGFLTLIIKTLGDASSAPKKIEDMKYAFPLMPRTDFRSMFRSMGQTSQSYMTALWNEGSGPLANAIHDWDDLDNPIFPNQYKGDPDASGQRQSYTGPTKKEWLDSMISSAPGRDALSPAPGYNRLEGFGSLGADEEDPEKILLEFRSLAEIGGNTSPTISPLKWRELASAFFNLVEAVTNPTDPPQPVQNVPISSPVSKRRRVI